MHGRGADKMVETLVVDELDQEAPSDNKLLLFIISLLVIVSLVRIGALLLPYLNAPAVGAPVQLGRQYYVTVTSLSFETQNADAAADEHVPAVSFQIVSGGKVVYESAVKRGNPAVWTGADIDLRQVAFTPRRVNVDVLVQAPRITAALTDQPDLLIRVFEGQVGERLVDEIPLRSSELRIGDNVRALDTQAAKSMTLRVADVEWAEGMLR